MYHKWQSYDVWFLRYEVWWTEFFVILDCFFLFYPPKKSKNQNFEKAPGDIIILHKCSKKNDHILHCSLDMVHKGFNCYFSFWAIFLPFTPLTAQKIKILKKWRKPLEISLFYTSVPKIMITCYTVSEIWRMTDVIVIFHFRLFFALLLPPPPPSPPPPPNSPKNQKNEENVWRYDHFTCVYQKFWSDDVWFPRNSARQMDEQTRKVTYRGGCSHLKMKWNLFLLKLPTKKNQIL